MVENLFLKKMNMEQAGWRFLFGALTEADTTSELTTGSLPGQTFHSVDVKHADIRTPRLSVLFL